MTNNDTNMNGSDVLGRRGNTIFVRLPRALWRECGTCACPTCKGSVGYWDTLAIAATRTPGQADTTWTVHMPNAADAR